MDVKIGQIRSTRELFAFYKITGVYRKNRIDYMWLDKCYSSEIHENDRVENGEFLLTYDNLCFRKLFGLRLEDK